MLNLITQDGTESVSITNHEVVGLQIDGVLKLGFAVPICLSCTSITRMHFSKTGVAKKLEVPVPETSCAWFDCSDRAAVVTFLA